MRRPILGLLLLALTLLAAPFALAAAPNSIADNGTNYTAWIGPTVDPAATARVLDDSGRNLTYDALGGLDDANASLDTFSLDGLIGALSNPYAGLGPIVIVFIGSTIAVILYIKMDGSLLVPAITMLATGMVGSWTALYLGVPAEWVMFGMFLLAALTAGTLLIVIVGRR